MKSWARFPFVRYTAALAVGIGGYVLTEQTPRVLWGIALASGLLTGFFALVSPKHQRRNAPLLRGIPALVFLSTVGWVLAASRSEHSAATHLGKVSGIQAYEATLVALPEIKPSFYRTVARVSRVRTPKGWEPATGRVQVLISRNAPPPRYGDVLLVAATPLPVEPPRNPAEFDYRRYLRFQNIFHRNYLEPGNFVRLGNRPPNALVALACRLNRVADSVLTAQLGDRREAGVAKAMLLGVRDDLDPDVLQAYSASGAIHVLSVSGLHVAVLFAVLGACLQVLKKRGRGGKWLYASLMLTLLWSYALLTGLSPAVLRSAAMISFFVVREAVQRQPSTYNTLFASAFALLLYDPFLLVSAGFQLSFVAVLGIVYLEPRIERWWTIENGAGRWLWRITATALAAQLATFPLAVYYFHQFPVYFLVANPAVIGISTFTQPLGIALLLFHWFPLLSEVLAFFTRQAFWLLNESAIQTERLPHAVWRYLHLSAWELIGVYGLLVSGLALFYTRQKRYAWATAAVAVVFSTASVAKKASQHRQRMLVVHHVRKHTALSLVDGNTLLVLADSGAVGKPRELDFSCANFWAERGIRRVELRSLEKLQPDGVVRIEPAQGSTWVLAWHGHRVMGLAAPTPGLKTEIPVDFCLVQGEAARTPIRAHTLDAFVLDGSCKTGQIKKWRQAGQPVYATAERGALVIRF